MQNFKYVELARPLLEKYQEILLTWQKKVNLISNSTINDIWNRHILDSAQLYPLIPEYSKSLIDVGSGAGFPGLVIAILNAVNKGPLTQITLVDSDMKKSLFLQEVCRKLDLKVNVLCQRMEKVEGIADVITARAVAPVADLLKLVDKNVSRETLLLFLKGQNVENELQNLPKCYMIQQKVSISDNSGRIVMIRKDSNE